MQITFCGGKSPPRFNQKAGIGFEMGKAVEAFCFPLPPLRGQMFCIGCPERNRAPATPPIFVLIIEKHFVIGRQLYVLEERRLLLLCQQKGGRV